MSGILFLAHRIPYPPDKGDKIRSWHMLRHLAARAPVHLGAFVDDPADFAHAPVLERLCTSVKLLPLSAASRPWRGANALLHGAPLSIGFYADRAMRSWVDRTVSEQSIGAVFGFSGQMAPYALPHVAGRRSVMDFVDLDSAKWAQYAAEATGPKRWLFAREASRLLAFEAQAARAFDAALFVSEAEAALFRARCGADGARVIAVQNGVDAGFFDPAADFPSVPAEGAIRPAPTAVFTGAMDYRPNIDAVLWFAAEVWPTILATVPDAEFLIVGSKPDAAVTVLGGREGIRVTGRVADVRPYLAAASVAVAPLRIARGIQNKVLEAMAMAKPVVATPEAYEGLSLAPPRNILVEREPAAFAAAVTALLREPERGRAIGAAARSAVLSAYAWEPHLRVLDELLLGTPAGAESVAA
jgi:sugar transferase (PEP-CTERM/EpsH1 system associated)